MHLHPQPDRSHSQHLYLDHHRRGDRELARRPSTSSIGHNDIVRQIRYALFRLTEPVLGPIRRFLPDLGGIDLSPIVALIAIWFLRSLLWEYGPRLLA